MLWGMRTLNAVIEVTKRMSVNILCMPRVNPVFGWLRVCMSRRGPFVDVYVVYIVFIQSKWHTLYVDHIVVIVDHIVVVVCNCNIVTMKYVYCYVCRRLISRLYLCRLSHSNLSKLLAALTFGISA